MHRTPANFENSSVCVTYFVQLTSQRIMPCGMAKGHRQPRESGLTHCHDRPAAHGNQRSRSGGISILEVHGRLTIGEPADQLHDALQSVIKAGAKKVIVILNGIPQIDSSGISTRCASPSNWPAKAASCAWSAARAASRRPHRHPPRRSLPTFESESAASKIRLDTISFRGKFISNFGAILERTYGREYPPFFQFGEDQLGASFQRLKHAQSLNATPSRTGPFFLQLLRQIRTDMAFGSRGLFQHQHVRNRSRNSGCALSSAPSGFPWSRNSRPAVLPANPHEHHASAPFR